MKHIVARSSTDTDTILSRMVTYYFLREEPWIMDLTPGASHLPERQGAPQDPHGPLLPSLQDPRYGVLSQPHYRGLRQFWFSALGSRGLIMELHAVLAISMCSSESTLFPSTSRVKSETSHS